MLRHGVKGAPAAGCHHFLKAWLIDLPECQTGRLR
jgi:hypothetical protein